MKNKELQYAEIREQIKDCDVLLYRGNDIISKFIRLWFESPYTHAGIVIWWYDRLMVLEAVRRGVMARPLSESLRHYQGGVDLFQVKVEPGGEKRTAMAQFAQQQLGKEFDLWALLRSGLRLVLGLSLKDRSGALKYPAGRYFCSQYVSDIYEEGGVDLAIELSSKRTSPDAIAKSPLLQFVGVLKAGAQGA